MKVELRHVRQFLAVAETLNFHRAAENLSMAQPALSRGIQALEHQVGAPLLTRSNREVALTPAGRAFRSACNDLVHDLERAIFLARQAHAGLHGVLTIGYTDFAISGMLPGFLRGFRRLYPNIALDLYYGATEHQIEGLETGRIDIAFLTRPISGSYLRHLPVQSEVLGVCMSVRHPMAGQPALHLRALVDEDWIFGIPSRWRQFRRHVDQLFLGAGFVPKIVQEAYNTDSIIGLVAADIGITIHVANANARHREDVVFIPLLGQKAELVTEAVWHSHVDQPVLERFVSCLQAYIERSH